MRTCSGEKSIRVGGAGGGLLSGLWKKKGVKESNRSERKNSSFYNRVHI